MSKLATAGKMRLGNSPTGEGRPRGAGEDEWWVTLAIRALAPGVLFALLLLVIIARLMATQEAGIDGPLAGILVLVLVLGAARLCPRRD